MVRAAPVLLLVLYAGLCKALLFHNLEYPGADLFSALEQSWSWFYAGRLLHDNAYGNAYAIHNTYLLLAFSPLTIPLGAYGLILGLVLLNGLAALRVALSAALDLPGRLVVLVSIFSPLGFFVFDHPEWGFHPELCYVPLALLLALDLAERKTGRAILIAALMMLVKEDGPVLCAAVLIAYFAGRFWGVRRGPPEERRRVIVTAFLSLLAVTAVFLIGMAILAVASRQLAGTQDTATARTLGSLDQVARTLAGKGRPGKRLVLRDGLVTYILIATLALLPLGRRFGRGMLLFLLSSPPLLVVLVISSAGYAFFLLLWAPRVATLFGLLLACSVFASCAAAASATGPRRWTTIGAVMALAVVSWGFQLMLLGRHGYAPWPRLNVVALIEERGYSLSALPRNEVRFLRCLAGRLPRGLPVYSVPNTHPVFHRQSILLQGLEARAWHPARLRVVPAADAEPQPRAGSCRGPRVGDLVVEADCDLLPLIADCSGWDKDQVR